MEKESQHNLIIAAITPEFLDRGVLWFSENEKRLKQESRLNPFLKRHVLVLEMEQKINLYQLLKQLTDFGYGRVQTVGHPGEFSQQGGLLKIFPINKEQIFQLEFSGQEIESICALKTVSLFSSRKKVAPSLALAKTLCPGDFVVHLDHGIGIFQGIVTKNNQPYFYIAYAKKDKLFVPLNLEEKISPYIGFTTPTVHRLSGSLWTKIKKRAKEETIKFARELLALYAQRQRERGFSFPPEQWLERELAGNFPFQETPDQKQAIKEVLQDMEKSRPMDRLVCGDVGFGKTEVALRAAFRAVLGKKQVALLAPTTILARQHLDTFKSRLEKFSVKISLLSRLVAKSEQKKIIAQIQNGQVDILIGTHRLIQKDVSFKDPGLLIIDEEQRFGVKQKERLKALRHNVDVLSLSATPIPRTLHLALSGLREISQITTPPQGRLPVKNFLLPFNQKTIKRAVEFELARHGQIYFLHNRVATIDLVVKKLKKFFPQARLARIHGRLKETELIRTIDDFKNKKIDILVATTIIENGLDFPEVNTLIVSDASRLGLAQAYQLRGRIGRANQQAFAYFLYPKKRLGEKAQLRLEALRRAETLGSGYQVALKDLELRGAGNILGREQSGTLNAVGLNLYYQMLSETLEEMKN